MRSLKVALCVTVLIGVIFILHLYNNGLALIEQPKPDALNKRRNQDNAVNEVWQELQEKEKMRMTNELEKIHELVKEKEALIENLFERIRQLNVQSEVLQNHLNGCQEDVEELLKVCENDEPKNGTENLQNENSSLERKFKPSQAVHKMPPATNTHDKPNLNEQSREVPRKIGFMKNLQYVSFGKWHYFEAEPPVRPSARFIDPQTNKTLVGDQHLIDAIEQAVVLINQSSELAPRGKNSRGVTKEDLNEGVYRVDMNAGVQYDMFFRDKTTSDIYEVRLLKSFSKLEPVLRPQVVSRTKELINLILPISGRLERFRRFIALFAEVCIKQDKRVFLTVVLYGKKDFHYIKKVLRHIEKTYKYKDYQLIMRERPFSRGRALHDGVSFWNGDRDVLMFFCDVDVTFNANFLRRCRMYTEPGQRIYYPIVFSLYNPSLVYGSKPPSGVKMLRIGDNTGYWREVGYGMTCQYQSDYLAAGGFDLSIEGWGSEDVNLYHKHLRSSARIIRAPDRGIFHYWHEKTCNINLNWKQYKACIRSKIRAEGSRAQVGVQWLRAIGELPNDETIFWD